MLYFAGVSNYGQTFQCEINNMQRNSLIIILSVPIFGILGEPLESTYFSWKESYECFQESLKCADSKLVKSTIVL